MTATAATLAGAHRLYVVALYLFDGVGGLLALAWFVMTGRRFLTLKA